METLLIAVTGLSLAMALGMGGLVLRLVREERRRSDARVAALIDMASEGAEGAPPSIPAPPVAPVARRFDASPSGVNRTALPRATPKLNRETTGPRPPAAVTEAEGESDLELRPAAAASTAVVGDLFVTPVRSSNRAARLTVAAGLAAVSTIAGYLLLSSGAGPVPAAAGATAGAPAAAPLELLSLQHTQQDSGLAVTGLVQNPRSGATLTRVIATAFAFGADGTFLASGRAPIDFTSLAPGAESPFVVQVPVTGAVARYRVGFRSEGGEVIAHVDKRTAEAIARK